MNEPMNRSLSASCPMEAAVSGISEPEKMVEAIKAFAGVGAPQLAS